MYFTKILKLLFLLSFSIILLTSCQKPKEAKRSFAVTFDSQGGTIVPSVNVQEGEKLTNPSDNPIKTGHIFSGWFKDAAGVTIFDFSSETIKAATTLYAKWEKANYVVSFVMNGGEPQLDPVEVPYDEKITRPRPNPTRQGYTFLGWYKDVDLTMPFDFDNETITTVVRIYIKWSQE